MQFSFDKFTKKSTPSQQPSSQADSNSADERLRKAIERNRAKLAAKQAGTGSNPMMNSASAPSRPMPSAQNNSSNLGQARSFSSNNMTNSGTQADAQGQSLLDRMRANREQSASMSSRPLPKAAPTMQEEQVSASRKMITDPDKIELNGVIRKTSNAPAVVNYTESQIVPRQTIHKKLSAKRKLKTKTKFDTTSTMSLFAKGAWVFCIFLVARLIFSEGGVIEYYQKTSKFNQKNFELETTKQENIELMKELELIQSDGKYQKKLVRDHLGYIARDEYLILFSKNPTQEQLNSDVSSI